MFESFTDRARKVMALASMEGQRLNHECIGPEHLLLGLVIEGSGTAANILKRFGVHLRKVRVEVERRVNRGPETVANKRLPLPQTAQNKKVLESAIEEARKLRHTHVGTEHLLLGLLGEHGGVATDVLGSFQVDLLRVRAEVENDLESTRVRGSRPKPSPPANRVLDYAVGLASRLNHDHVDTAHLLLGLLHERDSVATQVLTEFGLKRDEVREELMKRIRYGPERP